MSRGMGRIERGIVAAFEAEPHNAFTTDDLIDRIFPGLNRIEKKHRVSVCRAVRSLEARSGDYRVTFCEGVGGVLAIYRVHDLDSFAMGMLKSGTNYYRSRDAASWQVAAKMALLSPREQEAELLRLIGPGGKFEDRIKEGGPWWRVVRLWVARRDGEYAVIDELESKSAREMAVAKARLGIAS